MTRPAPKTKGFPALLAAAALLLPSAAYAAAPGPSILFLSPASGATIGATETIRVQVYDADGFGASPVLVGIDVAAATAMTENAAIQAAYCNVGGATFTASVCKVFEYTPGAAIAVGAHTINVQATDSTAQVSTRSAAVTVSATGTGSTLRRTNSSQICQDCHALQTHSSQYNTTTYGSWGNECQVCHTPHGTTNIYLVRPTITTPNSGAKTVTFQNTTGVAANSYGTPTASGVGVNVCEVCHTQTKNGDGTARARNNAATDWTKHYTGDCIGCHGHGGGFKAGESGGGTTCSGCHSSIWNKMQATGGSAYKHTIGVNAFADDTLTWGNPLSANAAAARSCVNTCHNDHPHTATDAASPTLHNYMAYDDATSSLTRAANTRTVATKANTDFDNALPTGGLCISCHRNPVDATHPAIAQASYAAGAHNVTTTTPGGAWQYTVHDGSTFTRNCTKCHWDAADGTTPAVTATGIGGVHGGANPSLLSGTTNPAGTPAGFVCYRCHGNGTVGVNYSNKDLATVFAKTYGHPANADATHNDVAEATNATWGNALGGGARHANCQDCHDPHAAKAGVNELSQATATYVTGTATFTNASATVTGQGTTWAAATHGTGAWYIKNNADGRWYRVTAVASATSLTIETAYLGTTAATSAYTLKQRAYTNLAGPTLEANWGAQVTTMPAANWGQTSSATFTKKTIVSGTDLEATVCFKCHSSYYWGQQGSGTGAGTAAFATTGVVTGTGTNWTIQMVGMSIKPSTGTTWYTISAFTSATSITVTPLPAAATTAAAYNLAVTEQGDPQGTTYVTGTAAFATTGTVTGTGTTWNATTHPGWLIKNNANGVWYKVIAVASGTSLTVAPNPPAAIAAAAYTLAVPQTDVASEFATTNASYHPVLGALPATDPGANGSSQLVAAQLVNGWTPGQTMSCSDCHGNDSVSPAAQGPHGSAIKFTLRGVSGQVYWPTNSAGTTYTIGGAASTRAGLFCLNCHPDQMATASNAIHRLSSAKATEHSGNFYRCIGCHIVVPHGGKVSRLIGTNTAGMQARYAYQGNKANFFMTMFTKTTKDAYTWGSFGRSCTEHTPNATTGETW